MFPFVVVLVSLLVCSFLSGDKSDYRVLQLENSFPIYLTIQWPCFLIPDARNSFPLIIVATKSHFSLPPSLSLSLIFNYLLDNFNAPILINMRDVIQNLLNLRSIEI